MEECARDMMLGGIAAELPIHHEKHSRESAKAFFCCCCWEITSPLRPLGLLECAARVRGSHLYGFAQGLEIFSLRARLSHVLAYEVSRAAVVSTSEMYKCAE